MKSHGACRPTASTWPASSAPEQGFGRRIFVELVFDSGFAFPFKFTTAVRVTPDTLPFQGAPVDGDKCRPRAER